MLFIGSLFLTQINLKVARLAPMEVKLIVEVVTDGMSNFNVNIFYLFFLGYCNVHHYFSDSGAIQR